MALVKKKWFGVLTLGAAVALGLTACGGGDGSPGETNLQYSLTLTADRTSLPVNIQHQPAGTGVYAPYTTTLYVDARQGGRPIPAGEDVFGCNVAGGLDTGSLYYLDGDDEHEDEDGNPLPFRSIVLGANSGGNSFHFHAGDTAGTSTITCSVTDPRDKRQYSDSVEITVGGATGLPASVNFQAQAPYYLGSLNNTSSIRNNVGLQAIVFDDANQRVADPSASNVQVRILPKTEAAEGARLLQSTGRDGQTVTAQTRNGVAQFSLSSGPKAGTILLELMTDRRDNDVANGIADPIAQLLAISVVNGIPQGPLAFEGLDLGEVDQGALIAEVLEAEGGLLPYRWEEIDGLPAGLSLEPSGVLVGTVIAKPGNYAFRVRVMDDNANQAVNWVYVSVKAEPLEIDTDGMPSSVLKDEGFSFAVKATGGVPPYQWELVGASGLSISADGIITGQIDTAGSHTFVIKVTDDAGNVQTANASIEVKDP